MHGDTLQEADTPYKAPACQDRQRGSVRGYTMGHVERGYTIQAMIGLV